MSILIKNVILNNQKKDILIKENKIDLIKDEILEKAEIVIDVKKEKAVLPGFINCHTHSAMTILRGCADDLPLNEWLFEKIIPSEEKLTNEDIYWGTKFACIEMIKSGTTFFNEMYLFKGLEGSVRAIEEIGMRAIVGISFDDDSLEKTQNFCDKKEFKITELIDYSIAPHAIYSVSKKGLEWAKEYAEKNDMLLHMHLSETQNEINYSLEKYGKKPVEFLNEIGFLNNRCIFAHAIWLNNKEIELLAENDCNLVYNPCSNMKLASGVFRFEDVQAKGVNICIGTDGTASNDDLDIIEEMKIGSLLQKSNDINPVSAKAVEMVKVATENGAKALRKKTGKIEEGYLADLILIDLKKSYFTPCYNFISDLVYASNGECVSDVICNGEILMRDRIIAGGEEVIKNIKRISKKFK